MEEWKKIDGYENYNVSSEGNVRNDKTGKILKRHIDKSDGYEVVRLCKNGIAKKFRIHRLVAIAFIPNPDNKQFIDHIDTIKTNNKVENLRWVSHEENMNNPLTINKMSESHKGKQFSEKHKRKLKENHADFSGEKHPNHKKIILLNTGEIFDCIKQASEKYKINNSSITNCCKGKYKSAGKHPETGEKLVWMYLEDYLKLQEAII